MTRINIKNASIYKKYIPLLNRFMKTISLKLDESIFNDTEEIIEKLKLPRNRYINEAVRVYNQLNKRRLLKNQFKEESAASAIDSMELLAEMELLQDEN